MSKIAPIWIIPVFGLGIQINIINRCLSFKNSRLLALMPLTTYKDCSDPRLFTFHLQTKICYATFFSVFVLYTVSILSVRLILRAEVICLRFLFDNIYLNEFSGWTFWVCKSFFPTGKGYSFKMDDGA